MQRYEFELFFERTRRGMSGTLACSITTQRQPDARLTGPRPRGQGSMKPTPRKCARVVGSPVEAKVSTYMHPVLPGPACQSTSTSESGFFSLGALSLDFGLSGLSVCRVPIVGRRCCLDFSSKSTTSFPFKPWDFMTSIILCEVIPLPQIYSYLFARPRIVGLAVPSDQPGMLSRAAMILRTILANSYISLLYSTFIPRRRLTSIYLSSGIVFRLTADSPASRHV